MEQLSGTTLDEAVRLVKSGDRLAAARLLSGLIQKEPGNAKAWLWMASSLDDPEKQRYCLQRALQLDPGNLEIKQALAQLEEGTAGNNQSHDVTPQSESSTSTAAPAPEPSAMPEKAVIEDAVPVTSGTAASQVQDQEVPVHPMGPFKGAVSYPVPPESNLQPVPKRRSSLVPAVIILGILIILAVLFYLGVMHYL